MPAIRRQGRRLVRARMAILFGCVGTWAFPRRFCVCGCVVVSPPRATFFGSRPKEGKGLAPDIRFFAQAKNALALSQFQGHAATGHPWPIAALAASMPLNPGTPTPLGLLYGAVGVFGCFPGSLQSQSQSQSQSQAVAQSLFVGARGTPSSCSRTAPQGTADFVRRRVRGTLLPVCSGVTGADLVREIRCGVLRSSARQPTYLARAGVECGVSTLFEELRGTRPVGAGHARDPSAGPAVSPGDSPVSVRRSDGLRGQGPLLREPAPAGKVGAGAGREHGSLLQGGVAGTGGVAREFANKATPTGRACGWWPRSAAPRLAVPGAARTRSPATPLPAVA